jgi:ABC-2 type transport system ATP-binding protein
MIQVEGLTKYYGDRAAIRDLSFTIESGEVIGFLGLNGAGKTTTLRVLGCVLLPTSGRVVIDGIDVSEDPHELRRRIGFLPDTPPLYDEMTVGGYLTFVAQLRGVPPTDVQRRVAEVEAKCALGDHHEELIGSLSHGYRQRVGVAQAMVHRPKLLILDEPTGGLDPVQIVEMRELIRTLKGEHTVLVSSHILDEISQICDRYLVIQAGELIAQGTEEQLSRTLGSSGQVELEVGGPLERALAAVKTVPGVGDVQASTSASGTSVLRVEASPDLRPALVKALVAADLDVLRIDKATHRLERIFLSLTHGKETA